MFHSPWILDEPSLSIVVEIDQNDERNQVLEQDLDEKEMIVNEVVKDINPNNIGIKISKICEKNGYAISAKVGCFVQGIELANYLD